MNTTPPAGETIQQEVLQMKKSVTLGHVTYAVSDLFSSSQYTKKDLLRMALEKKLAEVQAIDHGGRCDV